MDTDVTTPAAAPDGTDTGRAPSTEALATMEAELAELEAELAELEAELAELEAGDGSDG